MTTQIFRTGAVAAKQVLLPSTGYSNCWPGEWSVVKNAQIFGILGESMEEAAMGTAAIGALSLADGDDEITAALAMARNEKKANRRIVTKVML